MKATQRGEMMKTTISNHPDVISLCNLNVSLWQTEETRVFQSPSLCLERSQSNPSQGDLLTQEGLAETAVLRRLLSVMDRAFSAL
jgi:hypothetical protein